ncbi:hypothetical protein K469DRAFT_756484 [Zopfia rhizophila CBS 207.26]|uniref:Fungal N-terminal domain-containing protein n=1 Tax=Zopfia rhizophila CBS 207.26 TaxID=1314779 RepID=A0A6A6DBK0_9PEZI|nr:hypothetical protein K469DRAFT_756484 [Zopfia rhizophila CBS 207.26]
METLAIIGLVGNIVQFVDFSGKLIAKSTELYRSSEGALLENIDAETATNHLVLLNNKLQDTATTASDEALKRLCESCKSTANELLAALDGVKVNEGRLSRFREELNLHVVVDLREQVLRLESDHIDHFKNLDSVTQEILDAIIKQQDVFKAVHDTQSAQIRTLHSKMVLRVKNEHVTTHFIGLRGVSKTQITLKLAYRTRNKRPECSVFELKKTDSSTKSTRLINSLLRSDKESIVFTTRSRKAVIRFTHGNVIHVAEMDKKVAAQVLRNSLVNKEVLSDGPAMVQLLRLLTFLSLAIVQAAAYINENDISLTQYVSLFDDCKENIIEVLSEDFKDKGRYYDTKNLITTTWLILFEQIQARDALAADYLLFISYIDPKEVPLSLLPPALTKKKEINAIRTLSAYSFIIKRPADKCLDLYRLVHLATRN